MGEPIISEVLVKNNRALITLKDVGSVYFEHLHRFPSKILKPAVKKEVFDAFSGHTLTEFKRIPQFNIVQLTEQVDFPERLKKENPPSYALFKKRFVTGHYTPQLRWHLGIPWGHAEVDKRLLEVLQDKRQREQILHDAITYAKQTLRTSARAKQRRITKHADYVAGNWCGLTTVLDDPGFTEKQQRVEDERFALEQRVQALLGKGTVEINPIDKTFDIILPKNEYIKPTASITADELFNSRFYLLDIEKPLFDTPEEEVSWLAGVLIDKGAIVKKTIKTTRDPGIDRLGDWIIERYKREQDIAAAVEREITTPDNGRTVDIALAYNAPYDIEGTEHAAENDWEVGERDEDPKVEVGIDFFRKVRIPGRLILDPLRWARIRYRDLPNRKLELILAEAHGVEHAKALNYDQLAELERVAKTGNVTHLSRDTAQLLANWSTLPLEDILANRIPRIDQLCARLEAQYVSTDVDELHKMAFSQWARDHVEDAIWLRNAYNVELSRLLHSTSTINDAQERAYWKSVGTYRDVIYLKTKTMTRLQQKARSHLAERIKAKLLPEGTLHTGYQSNVAKVYLPLGLWLVEHVAGFNPDTKQSRFQEALKLRDYALQHRADKRRFFTLCQYLDALANYILVDFGLYNLAVTQYQDLLEHNQVDRKVFEQYAHNRPTHPELVQKLKEHDIPEEAFRTFRLQYRGILQEESEWAVKHFDRGTLTARGIARHPDLAADFSVTHNLHIDKLEELLTIAGKEFKGEQAIDPSLEKLSADQWQELVDASERVRKRKCKIFGQYNVDADEIKQTLNQKLQDFVTFCSKNRYLLWHAQGGFVYLLHGNRDALTSPDAPVILLDEIDKAYLCPSSADTRNLPAWQTREHKIHYRKHQYYEGLKVTNRPTHQHTMFEMEWYQKIIDSILDRDYEQALSFANECLDTLRDIIAEKQADIEHWKNQSLPPNVEIDTSTFDPYLTVPKRAFLWLSKRKEIYRGYEHGTLVHFMTPEAFEAAKKDKEFAKKKLEIDQRTHRNYFTEQKRKNSEELQNIYVMREHEFQPDVRIYHDRIKERIRDLIEPLCGVVNSAAFVGKSQKDVMKFLRTDPFL